MRRRVRSAAAAVTNSGDENSAVLDFVIPKGETANVAFSQMIRVDTVPNVLELISQSGNFFYSAVNMTIQKIGKLPEV